MADTFIYNKKDFLESISSLIEPEDIMIVSNSFIGSVTLNKRKNTKSVQFGFAADAFKKSDCISDIGFGEVGSYAFCVCNPDRVSDAAKKVLADKNKKTKR